MKPQAKIKGKQENGPLLNVDPTIGEYLYKDKQQPQDGNAQNRDQDSTWDVQQNVLTGRK